MKQDFGKKILSEAVIHGDQAHGSIEKDLISLHREDQSLRPELVAFKIDNSFLFADKTNKAIKERDMEHLTSRLILSSPNFSLTSRAGFLILNKMCN